MTILRSTVLAAAAFGLIGFMPAASAQLSQGEDYRQAVDIERDGFGEDYASQKLAAEEARQNSRSISKTVAPYVSSAMKSAQSGDFDKTMIQAAKGLTMASLTPYEKSVLYQLQAAANLKLGNYSEASQSYSLALATEGMNDDETAKVEGTLAKLRAAGVQ